MTETEFTPVYLFTAEERKKASAEIYATNIEKNNLFLKECSILLNKELTKKEIQSALKDPAVFSLKVKEIIREGFQFPKATEQFNLDAQGINLDRLNSLSNIQNDGHKYLIEKSMVLPDPKHLKNLEEQSKVYTKNEKQNKALAIAENIKQSANDLIELGIAFNNTGFNYSRATNQLVQNDTNSLKINYTKILSIT